MKTPRIVVALIATLTIAGCANKQDPKEEFAALSDMPPSQYVVRCDAGPAVEVNAFLMACRDRTLKICGDFDVTAVYGDIKKAPYWLIMGINCRKGTAL